MKASRTFAHTPSSVRAARRFAGDVLDGVDGDVVADVTLMLSELASNSVRHARSGFTVSILRTAERIRVEVSDEGANEPVLGSPSPDDLSGRGLRIVDDLSDGWGARSTRRSNSVWFERHLRPAQRNRTPVGDGHR